MEKLKLEITWASLWRVVFVVGLVALLYYLKDVALTILLSIFISTAINGIVMRLETFRIPRILSTMIVFSASIGVLIVVLYTIVPIAIIELNTLLNNFDGVIGNVLGPETTAKIRSFINPDLNYLANILLAGSASFLDVASKLLGGVAHFFTVLVLSFYLTISRDGVPNFLRALLPISIEERAVQIYERVKRKVTRWFHGQLILSLIVSVAVFIGLITLGVKYALILAIVAGLLELVPVVGPIFAGALSIIIAMSESSSLGFYVFILFLVIQQLESNVLVPLMLRKAVDVHPVVVLIFILGGAQLAGFIGVLLSIPAALLMQDLIDEWVAKKKTDSVIS